jgi:hypothetical protein
MKQSIFEHKRTLPPVSASRLTFRRLRRPTRTPSVVATTSLGRYLDRLRWLFGG